MSCIICLLSNNDFFISSNICLIENEVLSNCINLVIKVITVGTNVLNAVDIPCIATNPRPKLAIYSPNGIASIILTIILIGIKIAFIIGNITLPILVKKLVAVLTI